MLCGIWLPTDHWMKDSILLLRCQSSKRLWHGLRTIIQTHQWWGCTFIYSEMAGERPFSVQQVYASHHGKADRWHAHKLLAMQRKLHSEIYGREAALPCCHWWSWQMWWPQGPMWDPLGPRNSYKATSTSNLLSHHPETHIIHTFSHNPIFGSTNLIKINLEDCDADADIWTLCTQEFEKIKGTHLLSWLATGPNLSPKIGRAFLRYPILWGRHQGSLSMHLLSWSTSKASAIILWLAWTSFVESLSNLIRMHHLQSWMLCMPTFFLAYQLSTPHSCYKSSVSW